VDEPRLLEAQMPFRSTEKRNNCSTSDNHERKKKEEGGSEKEETKLYCLEETNAKVVLRGGSLKRAGRLPLVTWGEEKIKKIEGKKKGRGMGDLRASELSSNAA